MNVCQAHQASQQRLICHSYVLMRANHVCWLGQVQVGSSSGSATNIVSFTQWQLHLKSAAKVAHPEGLRPLKRLCKAGDVAQRAPNSDLAASAAQISAVLSSALPLYATADVYSMVGSRPQHGTDPHTYAKQLLHVPHPGGV